MQGVIERRKRHPRVAGRDAPYAYRYSDRGDSTERQQYRSAPRLDSKNKESEKPQRARPIRDHTRLFGQQVQHTAGEERWIKPQSPRVAGDLASKVHQKQPEEAKRAILPR